MSVADQKAFEAATLDPNPKTFELGIPENVASLRRLGGIDCTLLEFKDMIGHDSTNLNHQLRTKFGVHMVSN